MFVRDQPGSDMNRRMIKLFVSVSVTVILAGSCAKISSPTGGPKDKEPPEIVISEPKNGQTNFKGKKISITFNEFVKLDKINEKFMVSPPMNKKPKISIRGKSVIIEYEEDLKDSTTYTFYFQDAIQDLNESNPLDNFQFVISTGNVLDSLSVTGNVYSSYSLDPPAETLILLYKNQSDSAVIKSLPDYITKATKTGYFRINNIREGQYRLYALKDNDNSKNFNLPDEEFAFLDTLVKVSAEKNYIPPVHDTIAAKIRVKKTADTVMITGDYKLILFKPAKKAHYLADSKRSSQYKFQYILSLPPDSARFDISITGAGKGAYYTERSSEGDTILVWLTDSSLYSQPQIESIVDYPFTDSLGRIIIKQDTIPMRYLAPRSPRGKAKVTPLKVTSSFSGGALKPGQAILFTSNSPFQAPDTSKIRIYELKEKDRVPVPYMFRRDTSNSCRLFLTAKLLQKKNYLFIADSAAFGNIYGEKSDSTGSRFIVRDDETFSKLKLNINNFEGKRIIQLLNEQDKVLREKTAEKDGSLEFTMLDKGKYRLRVIYDINGDGKWTTGDFLSGREPEPVSFYPTEIVLPENFWADNDWDIGQKNIKKVKSASTAGSKASPGR
jgi:uncharacterized protein (DUF2141 family)